MHVFLPNFWQNIDLCLEVERGEVDLPPLRHQAVAEVAEPLLGAGAGPLHRDRGGDRDRRGDQGRAGAGPRGGGGAQSLGDPGVGGAGVTPVRLNLRSLR